MTFTFDELTPRRVRAGSARPTMFDRLPAVYRDPARFRPTRILEPGPGEDLTAMTDDEMLELGAEGAATTAVQQALARARHDPGPADGAFGPRTQDAVRTFQRRRGLLVDGIVGPETLGELTAPLLQRFLDGLQDVFDPLLSTLDNLVAYIDVDTAPEAIVRWLAWMVGAGGSAGGDAARDRELVARALELHRREATRQGVAELVAIHLGIPTGRVRVTDGSSTSWDPDPHATVDVARSVKVTVEIPTEAVPRPLRDGEQLVAVVAATLPAGLTVELVLSG